MSKTTIPRRGGVSIPRVILCSLLLTVLVAGCLYIHHTALTFFRERMLEDESKTLAWFAKEIGFALPLIVICLFHYFVYHKWDSRDGAIRREMFWEVLLVTALTYAVLLPYLAKISEALYINALAAGVSIPETEGNVEITLLMELHEWFIRLTIPLGLLMAFHGLRARRETLFPESEEAPAPRMTVAEYEASKKADAEADTEK